MFDRKRSPGYPSINGNIERGLLTRFKALAIANELTISEALEEAIKLWLDNQDIQLVQKNRI